LVQRIRPAFGGVPNFVETGLGAGKVVSAPREFRNRDQCRQLELDPVDCPRPRKGVVQAFVGHPQVAQSQGRLTLEERSTDEIPVVPSNTRQPPRSVSASAGSAAVAEPKPPLRKIAVGEALALWIFPFGVDKEAPSERNVVRLMVASCAQRAAQLFLS
jgi:hypothetical protein